MNARHPIVRWLLEAVRGFVLLVLALATLAVLFGIFAQYALPQIERLAGGFADPFIALVVVNPVASFAIATFALLLAGLSTDFLADWVRTRYRLRQIRSTKGAAPGFSTVRPDTPIEYAEQDRFGRESFARDLARTIVLAPRSPSLVVALMDDWGQGKTSVVNMTRNCIRANWPEAIVVDFNPWELGSIAQMDEAFVSTFAHEISRQSLYGSSRRTLNQRFHSLLELGELFRSPSPQTAVGFLSSVNPNNRPTPAFKELQREIGEIIDSLQQPIVVIVDDLDRCVPDDIRRTIQLIKALCSYPRTAYLLGFDPEPVEKALSFEGQVDGQQFLQKVVQANFRLPRLGFLSRLVALKQDVSRAHTQLKRAWSPGEQERYEECARLTARVLTTPREIGRLANACAAIPSELYDEIDAGDLILIALLQSRFHNLWRMLAKQPHKFAEPRFLNEEYEQTGQALVNGSPEREKARAAFAASVLDRVPMDIRDDVQECMEALFPLSFRESSWASDVQEPRRVSRLNNLHAVLNRGFAAHLFAPSEIQNFYLHDENREEVVRDHIRAGDFEEWCNYAADAAPSDVSVPAALYETFARTVREQFTATGTNYVDCCTRVIRSAINAVEPRSRLGIYRHIAGSATCLSLSESVILLRLGEDRLWTNGVFHRERIDARTQGVADLAESWLQTARQTAATSDLLAEEPEPISVLFRWGQFERPPYSTVAEYLHGQLSNPEGLVRFTRGFPSGKGLSGVEKLVPSIASFIPNMLASGVEPIVVDRFSQYVDGLKVLSEPGDS